MYAKIGTFVGTGADQVVEVGWEADTVLVYAKSLGFGPQFHSREMVDATSSLLQGQAAFTSAGDVSLPSLTLTGFNCRLNAGVTFTYIALKAGTSKDFGTLIWTGNGADNRNLTGLGFQPDVILASSDGGEYSRMWHKDDPQGPDHAGPFISPQQWAANYIQSVAADGFQVGAAMNTNNVKYVALCFKEGDNCEAAYFHGDNTGDTVVSFPTLSSLGFIFSATSAFNGSNFCGAAPYRSTTNTNGFGQQVQAGGETPQSWKSFSGNSATLDTFFNNTNYHMFNLAIALAEPPTEDLPNTPLPELPGGGAGGMLPFAPYQRYKMLRALGQQLNNLVLGP